MSVPESTVDGIYEVVRRTENARDVDDRISSEAQTKKLKEGIRMLETGRNTRRLCITECTASRRQPNASTLSKSKLLEQLFNPLALFLVPMPLTVHPLPKRPHILAGTGCSECARHNTMIFMLDLLAQKLDIIHIVLDLGECVARPIGDYQQLGCQKELAPCNSNTQHPLCVHGGLRPDGDVNLDGIPGSTTTFRDICGESVWPRWGLGYADTTFSELLQGGQRWLLRQVEVQVLEESN